jgi:alanyl-tRNA synthetase
VNGQTRRLYRDDPYLLDFEAAVIARGEHGGRPAVILDRTAFYPEGGGQPWDTGTLAGVRVVAVVEERGGVWHVLGGPLPETEARVRGAVDAQRRRDHMQQHHGQHLLSRALVEVAGAATVSFHLGGEHSTIDLDRAVSDQDLRRAEALSNEVVWEARPVRVRMVTRREAEALGAHAAAEAGDEIRLVEAEGFDLQPCGGTHPHRTSEVGVVAVLGQERYKGASRVRFVCGQRAVDAFHDHAHILDRLGGLFSAPLAGLPEAADKTLARLAESERAAKELRERALAAEAERLASSVAGSQGVVTAIYEGRPPEELRALAIQVVARQPCVALLGSRGEKAHVVFAQSAGLSHDVPALLRAAVARLGGHGGGRGDVAQGGGDRVEALEEALAAAAAEVRRRNAGA